jgi:hypothetical protein
VRTLLALLLLTGTAQAGKHVVQRGETLEHVASAYGCSVGAVMRANGLKTTLVKPGTVIVVPSCTIRTRAQTRTRPATPRARPTSDEDRARAALAVIDGASWLAPTPVERTPVAPTTVEPTSVGDRAKPRLVPSDPRGLLASQSPSLGLPWDGALAIAAQLPRGDGYVIRRPNLAYGATHVVEHLRHVIAEVRALYPEVHTLAIGDISAERGGKLAAHRSHQTGLDVDVGFYFTRMPDGYPDRFAPADDTLDLQATWALVTAFARTSHLDDGVAIMFLDYAVQKRLHAWAHARGTPDRDLEQLFQYPRGKDSQVGLIRHWPNHADHVHVRFKSPRR